MMSRILSIAIFIGGGLSAAAVAQEPPNFQQIVQPYVDRGEVAGASGVVVTATGVVAFPTAGYADLESKRPMQRDTLFWMASTSKPLHVTAVMMLVDDGKLKLDDPVSKYLPGFKPRIDGHDPAHAITVRMLLNHTNGLQYSDPAAQMPPTDCCTLTELVARFAKLPLMFEPGTKFAYSNAGPDTACRIVEVVSGKDFETFIHTRLLDPLGMKDTTYFPNQEQLARLATVYWFSPTEHKLVRAPQQVFLTLPYDDRKIRHAPGGGLFSTGGDLARFAQMFLNKGVLDGHRYLSETSVYEMTHNQLSPEVSATIPQPPGGGPDVPASYGLGWGVGASGAYFHPGSASTNIRIDPTRGFAGIFLPQQAPDMAVLEMYRKLGEAAQQHWDAQSTQ